MMKLEKFEIKRLSSNTPEAKSSSYTLELYLATLGTSAILPPFATVSTKEYKVGERNYTTILFSLYSHNCKAMLYIEGRKILEAESKMPIRSVDVKITAMRKKCPVRMNIKLSNIHPTIVDCGACASVVYLRE